MVKRLLKVTAAAAAAGFALFAYLYLSLPDVRPLRSQNPGTTAFMELRAREADNAGKKPRKAQQWAPYERISANLRRAVIVAEDAAFFQQQGIDLDEIEKSLEASWKTGKHQMEPATHDDIWNHYLAHNQELGKRVNRWRVQYGNGMGADELVGNLYYATAMCRIHYLRVREPIPDTLPGQASYWKRFYNTRLGAGTESEYIQSWQQCAPSSMW